MKTTSLILMLILAVQVNANPQKERRNDLNLTEEQKTQMQVVKQNMHEQLKAARVEIQQQAHAEMANFLTAEQMQQVEERQQHRKEHQGKGKQHRGMKKGKNKARKEARDAE